MELTDLAKAMKQIDICMMATKHADGTVNSRPMSNNRDVDYEGDSYFFALDNTGAVSDLETDPKVCLSYVGEKDLYISISGQAELTQDKAEMQAHWVKDLENWFEDGIDTEGLTLIRVKADQVKYWDGMEEGEIPLN